MSWQSSRNNGKRPTRSLRRPVLLPARIMLAGSLITAVAAEKPCNPIIDGTYSCDQHAEESRICPFIGRHDAT